MMQIHVPQMVNEACADAIQKALIAQDGVQNVSCDLVNKTVDVVCNATFGDVVKSTIQSLGYTPQ